jgi:4-hydroxy-3-methylbut-2-en-1-yl diphosphate reductase
MELLLAQPRGFCAGVVRAIEAVECALAMYRAPVYVFHEIVHNPHVVADLRARGAVFVDAIEDIPPGSTVVFSAHGVSREVVQRARARRLRTIDATCPLVTKVHMQLARYARLGFALVMIGHPGHEEVEGTIGSVDCVVHLVSTIDDVEALPIEAGAPVAYVTQTTLSLDDTRGVIEALKRRYPGIQGPDVDDICYATQNRQRAVRVLAQQVDVVLVVGARNSSNSNRLREVAEQHGVPAWLIEDAADIEPQWLAGARRVGLTAGASAPESIVDRVRVRLRELGVQGVRELQGPQEYLVFKRPHELSLRAAQEPLPV